MSAKWYLEWASTHAKAFSFGDKGIESLAVWGSQWSKMYTRAELDHATAVLMSDMRIDREGRPLLRWPDEHRVAVPAAIIAERARLKRKATEQTEGHKCTACDNTGWRIVPHPGKDNDGKLKTVLSNEPYSHNVFNDPIFYTLAVTCDCQRGSQAESSGSLTFRNYDSLYYNWRLVAEHIEELKASRIPNQSEVTGDVGTIKRLLAASMSMPRPGDE